VSGFEGEGRKLFDAISTGMSALLYYDWIREEGRHLFDLSSTVLRAILNCECIGEGGGETCLMLAALCCVR